MEICYVSPGIESLEYWLPDSVIRNEDLAAEFTDWDPQKAFRATGIRERRFGAEPASEMASPNAIIFLSNKKMFFLNLEIFFPFI